MATLQNERDKSLQATVPRLIATTVVITGTAALFTKPNAVDPITPTSITLTGTTTVFTSPTLTWSYASNADMVWTSYGVGASKVLTSADFLTHLGATGTKVFYKVTATQFGYTSSESPIFEVTYTDLSGAAGEDAYHIRLDNESRWVRFDYTDTVIAGQLPLTAQVYVTKGASDITVGSGYVTYSINSTSGATGASVNSSGVVTVTGITLDTNYVEIKAIIDEPSLPAFNAYKKLYIYKQKDVPVEADIDITQDHYYYQYADSSSTTNIAAWSTITFTAVVGGVDGAVVTWSAKTYDSVGAEIAGTETIITPNGNTATVSAAQFVLRGGNTVRTMVVTASYIGNGGTIYDSAQILRYDPTSGSRILWITDTAGQQQTAITMTTDSTGEVSAGERLSEGVLGLYVYELSTGTPIDDTTGWAFTATPSTGITVDINSTGNGPYTAGSPVTLTITAIDIGTTTPGNTFSGTILVKATKATYPDVYASVTILVNWPLVAGAFLEVSPDSTIILPTDSSGNIVGYETAIRNVRVMNGSVDDTANWTLSRVDGPGVTSTFTGGVLSVSNFAATDTTVTFNTTSEGSVTSTSFNVYSHLVYNYSGTLMYITAATGAAGKSYVSTDHGTTWTSYTLPAPASPQIPNSYHNRFLIYSKFHNKFIFIYGSPSTGGNGRLYYSTDAINWTASTLANNAGSYAWAGLFEDTANGRVYVFDVNGTNILYSDNLTSWTTVSADNAANPCSMTGYNGKFVKFRVLSSVGVRYVYYSTNLTNWTNISSAYGTSEAITTIGNSGDLFVTAGSPYGTLVCSQGVQSVKGVPSTTWKNTSMGSSGWKYDSNLFAYAGTTKYVTGNTRLFCTSNSFASLQQVLLTPATVGTPVGSNGTHNNFAGAYIVGPADGQELPKYNGIHYLPIVNLLYSANLDRFWRGNITLGNDGYESYITVTATPNDPGKLPLTATVIVRKGVYTGDIYSLVVNPGTIQLPSTSDGKVYAAAFTNNTNVATYSVLKNGIPYTGGITGSITYTSGITAAVTGNGTNTGIVTVSAMTDALTDGSITGTVSIDGVLGQTLAVNIKVVKLRDGTTSGVYGSSVSAFSSTHTSIAVRFTPTGTVEISRGGGSYVRVADWYYPVTSATIGSSYYISMNASSDTGDIADFTGDGTTTVNTGTYYQLNVNRTWTLSDASSGTHRIILSPRLATSSGGANAIIGSGTLELQVP